MQRKTDIAVKVRFGHTASMLAELRLAGGVDRETIKDLPFLSSNFLYDTMRDWLFPKSRQFRLEAEIARSTVPLLLGSRWYTLLAKKPVERELEEGQLIEFPVRGLPIPPGRCYMVYRRDGAQQRALREWLTYFAESHPPSVFLYNFLLTMTERARMI